jgi:hypothetical protein
MPDMALYGSTYAEPWHWVKLSGKLNAPTALLSLSWNEPPPPPPPHSLPRKRGAASKKLFLFIVI